MFHAATGSRDLLGLRREDACRYLNPVTSRKPKVQHEIHFALVALASTSTEGTPIHELSGALLVNNRS